MFNGIKFIQYALPSVEGHIKRIYVGSGTHKEQFDQFKTDKVY